MALFKWTIKELEKVTKKNPEEAKKFIICCLHDRKKSLTNVNAPMWKKLDEVITIVEDTKF